MPYWAISYLGGIYVGEDTLVPGTKVKVKGWVFDHVVDPFDIIGLHPKEGYAKKMRAALCRKEFAIRDYYDLNYATINGIIDFSDNDFRILVKKKVRFANHFHTFNDPGTVRYLKSKIKSELEPTLKKRSIDDFTLERILEQLILFSAELLMAMEKTTENFN